MNKLLKDAIADAKAVRETALANAKLALEEAFAPKLQSMLSHKIKEEMSDEDEMVEMEDEEDFTMEMSYEDEMTSEGEGGEPEVEDEVEVSDEEEAEVEVSDEEEEMSDEELEEILRELEGDDEEEMTLEMDDMEEEDMTMEADDMEDTMEEEEEEVDLDEIIRALREEEGEEEEEVEDTEAELEEAYKVIKFLRSKLNEVNLLNAKLLFVNKLFKKADLSESKKIKIIETFDRVRTVREAKLVYTTLSESVTAAPISKKKPVAKGKNLNEGFASAPTKATKKPIIENTVYNRFSELINYNK